MLPDQTCAFGAALAPSLGWLFFARAATGVAIGLTGLSLTSANPASSDDSDTYNVTLSVTDGALSVGGAHTGLSGTFSGSSITFSGSLGNVNAALADNTISYTLPFADDVTTVFLRMNSSNSDGR